MPNHTDHLLAQYAEIVDTYQAAQGESGEDSTVRDYENYEDGLMTLVHELAAQLARLNAPHVVLLDTAQYKTLARVFEDSYYYRVGENDLDDEDDVESMDPDDLTYAQKGEALAHHIFGGN